MNMLAQAELQPFRLRIEDYELLDRAGAFPDRHVELIEGVVVEVNAETTAHTRLKNILARRLGTALEAIGSTLDAMVEPTVELPPHNMPQPDIAVADFTTEARYVGLRHVAIVIEVGASTVRSDLTVKRAMYAEQHLPEYWVVDVAHRQVHQFWAPMDGHYTQTRIVPLEGPLASATLSDLSIDGTGIL